MKKALIGSSIFVLLICIMSFTTTANDLNDIKTVRVGYVDIESFLAVNPDGSISGYGAEYLNRIAQYTKWNYEYKSGTWTECMEWLKTGEIDLLMPAEYSSERTHDYLFSEKECCLDYTALIGRKAEDKYFFEDFQAFNEMTIGLIQGNYLNNIFAQYAEEHNFTYKAIMFDTGRELTAALDNKQVDAIVNGNMTYTGNQKLLAKVDYMPAYFITSVKNKALMDELNTALHQIFLNNPYYTANLHLKYYGSLDHQAIGFTREESEYIKKMGEITVLVGNSGYPMEWYDEGSEAFKGVYVDIIRLIERESGLRFRFVADDNEADPLESMKNGKANVWGSAYLLDGNRPISGFNYTNTYYNCNYSLLGKKEKNINMSGAPVVGIIENDAGVASAIKKNWPHWSIKFYDDMNSCLSAVSNEEADFAVVNSWEVSIDDNIENSELVTIDNNVVNLAVSLAIPQGSDATLITVLNKAILKIDKKELQECIFNSILSEKDTISLSKLIQKYPIYIGAASCITLFFILMGIFMIYRNYTQKKQNNLLQMKNKELEDAISVSEQFKKEAQTDALTGLKNKSTIEYTCQNFLDKYPNQKHAIIIMDLDDFKHFNDSYGHLYGDAVLKQFGNILLDLSDDKCIVGRIGGDEFLMFMACVADKNEVERQVKLLYCDIKEKIEKIGNEHISCSVGIVISKIPHLRFKELFLKADQALYRAKKDGKDKYVIS